MNNQDQTKAESGGAGGDIALLGAEELKFTEQFNVKFAEFTSDYTIRFFAGKKEIGCFDFGKSPATFTGDVDESAKLFVEAVMQMWPAAPNDKGEAHRK